MELEKQVCSPNLAGRLDELGVKQDSHFVWGQGMSKRVGLFERVKCFLPIQAAAFTVAELADRLGFATGKNILRAYGHVFNVPDTHVITASGLQQCMTSPDTAAKMLIYLIGNKLVTV